jgi:hypothetical protein
MGYSADMPNYFTFSNPSPASWVYLAFGLSMLKPERRELRVSICPACGTRPELILSPVVFAWWCPSCRTDVRPTSRPYYELGEARWFTPSRLGVLDIGGA